MIIDTHLHVIDRSALSYPWLAATPALNRDFPYQKYAQEARRIGVRGALHMEVDVAPEQIGDETAYIAGLASRPDSLIRGVISACRPEAADFATFLEAAAANPLIRGFRRVLHVVPDELSEGPLFRQNVARLAAADRPFDLCVLARQLDRATALVDSAPNVRFVLDHCGVPDIAGGDIAPWRAAISEIARRPNVCAKISGVIAYAVPETWTVETIRPWVEHTVQAFGWDRVVWGGDWPVCTLGGGLSTWVASSLTLFSEVSADERAALFRHNATRIWAL